MIPPHTAPPCPPDWGLASFATNSPQTGFPCPLSTIVFFSPRYIGATQDLLRTSLLFRIHYPYTVHTVHTVLTCLLATHFPSKINIAKVVKNYDNVTSDNLLAVQQIFCWYSLSAYYTLLKNIQTALEVGQLGPPLCWGPFKFWQGHRGLGDHLLPFK